MEKGKGRNIKRANACIFRMVVSICSIRPIDRATLWRPIFAGSWYD